MPRRACLLCLAALLLTLTSAPAHAGIDPALVPLFQWRARVAQVEGKPPGDQPFAFTFGHGGATPAAAGGAWSEWTAFDREQAVSAVGKHSYPNTSMRSFPVVLKLNVTGVVDPTLVELEVRLDEAPGQTVAMSGELFGPALGVMLWRDEGETATPRVATMVEYNRRYWEAMAAADVPEHQRPKKFPIVDRFIGGDNDRRAWQEGIAQLSRAGFNGIMLPPDAKIREMLLAAGEEDTAWAVYNPPGYAFDHDPEITPEHIQKWAQDLAKPYLDAGYEPRNMLMYATSDEPGWYYPSVFGPLREIPRAMERFRQYLRDQGLTPRDVGAATWDEVEPLGRSGATNLPSKRLFYWTMRFFSWDSSRHFAVSTMALEDAFYPMMPIFTNWNFFAGRFYVPGPVANNPEAKKPDGQRDPDAAMGGHDWFEFGRMRGGTMLWTEDWFGDGQAYQWSFYATKLRDAAKLGGVEFGGYVIPRTAGQRDGGIIQKILAIAGHGGKAIKYFVFGPEYNFPGNCYSENMRVLPQMAEAHRMIGAAEELLWPGRPLTPQVYILMPRSAQVWDLKDERSPTTIYDATNTNLNARTVDYMAEVFNLFTALQHANIPTGWVDEDDLTAEGLRNVKVLYVTAPCIPVEGQEALVEWVKAGGRLVTVTGAGQRDRYNEPTDVLAKGLGFSEAPREPLAIRNVAELEPVGTVEAPGLKEDTVPAYGARGHVQAAPADAVSDRFDDGRPALLHARVGEGDVFHAAFFPGISYGRSADGTPVGPGGGLPSGWSASLRDLITAPVLDSERQQGFLRPVMADRPLVETPVLVSDQGAVATLLNWSGEPIEELELTLHLPFEPTSAESVLHGPVELTPGQEGVTVSLPLDEADFLLLRR